MADRRFLRARFFVTAAGVAYKKVWQFPLGKKYAVFERDGQECRYCGHPLGWALPRYEKVDGKLMAAFDHIVPRCRGGRNNPENIALCCEPCNNSKGASLLSEWTNRPAPYVAEESAA